MLFLLFSGWSFHSIRIRWGLGLVSVVVGSVEICGAKAADVGGDGAADGRQGIIVERCRRLGRFTAAVSESLGQWAAMQATWRAFWFDPPRNIEGVAKVKGASSREGRSNSTHSYFRPITLSPYHPPLAATVVIIVPDHSTTPQPPLRYRPLKTYPPTRSAWASPQLHAGTTMHASGRVEIGPASAARSHCPPSLLTPWPTRWCPARDCRYRPAPLTALTVSQLHATAATAAAAAAPPFRHYGTRHPVTRSLSLYQLI